VEARRSRALRSELLVLVVLPCSDMELPQQFVRKSWWLPNASLVDAEGGVGASSVWLVLQQQLRLVPGCVGPLSSGNDWGAVGCGVLGGEGGAWVVGD
jgi:hypothetical protein